MLLSDVICRLGLRLLWNISWQIYFSKLNLLERRDIKIRKWPGQVIMSKVNTWQGVWVQLPVQKKNPIISMQSVLISKQSDLNTDVICDCQVFTQCIDRNGMN